MPDFDKDLFMDKVKKNGCEITACGDIIFELHRFFAELPELRVICIYIAKNNTIGIEASMPIASDDMKQITTDLCDRLNSIARFHTEIQDDFIISDMELELSKIAYSDDNEALDYAAVFVLVFKREFERYGVKIYQYANTGNIKYLLD